jgi:hypothetical protein
LEEKSNFPRRFAVERQIGELMFKDALKKAEAVERQSKLPETKPVAPVAT